MEAKESIIGRLLATPFGQIYWMIRNRPEVLEPILFARDAALTIGTSLRLSDDDPSREHPEVSISGFGTFVEVKKGKIELHLEEQALYSIRAETPRPLNISGMKPWHEIITDELGNQGMCRVVAEALFAAFNQKKGIRNQSVFILNPQDLPRAAEIAFTAFFEALINTLVLRKKVNINGMEIAYDVAEDKIVFVPDLGMLRSAELFHLRKTPLTPIYPRTFQYTIGPTGEELEARRRRAIPGLTGFLVGVVYLCYWSFGFLSLVCRKAKKFYRVHIVPKPPRGIGQK